MSIDYQLPDRANHRPSAQVSFSREELDKILECLWLLCRVW